MYEAVGEASQIRIVRNGEHSHLTGDRLRAAVEMEIELRVIPTLDGAATAAQAFGQRIDRSCAGLRIGALKEGFHRPESEADVDAKVLAAVEQLRALVAQAQDISIEEHDFAADLWTAIAVESLQDLMVHGNHSGTNCSCRR